MLIFKKLALVIYALNLVPCLVKAQNKMSSYSFSAINGAESKPYTIVVKDKISAVQINQQDTTTFVFTVMARKPTSVTILFKPKNFIGVAHATLVLKIVGSNAPVLMALIGLSTKGLEGANEPPLATVVEALGYQVNIGWQTLDNNALPQLMGDEIAASQFTKAGDGDIEMLPVARYSPDFELPFGYYTTENSAPKKKQLGILATKNNYPQHQTLYPETLPVKPAVSPGKEKFGFYAEGASHAIYSEDVWNMLYHPANAVHAVRIYPLKSAAGQVIKHTYLVCFEEAKNGDFNDYVFVVKNITPITATAFTSLFNGKDLEGWDTYLQNIGTNKDPHTNFKIEEAKVHVNGKDLGYMITKKGFTNFHFKVDFKWGQNRWAPRDTFKRDAGICYNIPLNAPDSIWPASIECQIQEGDVGDFWLLGFSTIMVEGKKNLPSAHTRMIKKKDAEKPTGEWNTVEVISYKGKCVHIVNGVVVNVGEEASLQSGRLLLQSEYAEVYYQHMMIREL